MRSNPQDVFRSTAIQITIGEVAESGRLRLIRNQVYPQGYRGFESLPLRCSSTLWERCPSGRRGTIGNRVYRKVPRVRIPLSPPSDLLSFLWLWATLC